MTTLPVSEAEPKLLEATQMLADMTGAKKDRRIAFETFLITEAGKEGLPPASLIKAMSNYAAGKIEGESGAFFPAPGTILKEARAIWREAKSGSPTAQIKVKFPPAIQKKIDRINSKIASQKYKARKREQVIAYQLNKQIKKALATPSANEIAEEMIRRKISKPGTRFDIYGCEFPDGTRWTLKQMREAVNGK